MIRLDSTSASFLEDLTNITGVPVNDTSNHIAFRTMTGLDIIVEKPTMNSILIYIQVKNLVGNEHSMDLDDFYIELGGRILYFHDYAYIPTAHPHYRIMPKRYVKEPNIIITSDQ